MHKQLAKIIKEPLYFAWLLGYDKVKHSIHEEWIKETWRPGTSVIQGHRNSYKTTCAIIAVIRGLLFKPDTRIVIIRKSLEEAAKFISEIMAHYQSSTLRRLYYDVWKIAEPRDTTKWSETKGISLITNTKIAKERNLEPAGIGKYKTGSHYDLILADDIVSADDRYSEAERENTIKHTYEFVNILKNDGIGIKYSGTTWHEKDAYSKLPNIKKYPVSLNFIEELTPKRLQEIKDSMPEDLFSVNYKLEHIPDSKIIFRDQVYFVDYPDTPLIGYLDPAFSDGKNDCTALTVGNKFGHDIYIKYGKIWQEEIDDIYDLVEECILDWGISLLIVEANAAQIVVAKEFKKRGYRVGAIHQHKNKHFRIVHYARKYWTNILFDENVDDEYMSQILEYNIHAILKDAPDSLAGLIQYLKMTKSRVKISEANI